MVAAPKKVLVVRTDRLGDVVLTLPVAQALKEHLPGAEIGFLARDYTLPVLEMSPAVDIPLSIEAESAAERIKEFDAAILAHPTPKDALALRRAKIPIRIGTKYRAYSFLFTHRVAEHRKPCLHHEITYNLHLLRPLGIDVEWLVPVLVPPADACEQAFAVARRYGLAEGEFVAVHPGSGGSSLSWSADKFRAFVGALFRRGIPCAVTAGPGEEALAEYVSAGRAPIIEGLGLKVLAAFYKLSAAVVAPNTGTLHLADAVGTKAFGIYPVLRTMSPARWHPARNPGGAIVPNVPRCKRCSPKCPHFPCVDLIDPGDVAERVAEAIGL